MSLSDDAHALILTGDYIAADASGKLTCIGLNVSYCALGPAGITPPLYVAAIVDVPKKYWADEFPVALELRDSTGALFSVIGPLGTTDTLRISQLVRASVPVSTTGMYFPADLPVRAQFVVCFSNGLPLKAGESYEWSLTVDSRKDPAWRVTFHVVGPPPGPVIGGPDTSPDIPILEP